jgi:hypothetical protein
LTREQAIERARTAIAKHGWPLRTDYRVIVAKSSADVELGDSFEVYVVAFTARGAQGQVIPLYAVHIDRRTGNCDVIDERRSVRDEEVNVARRAFEKKFHLRENQYATTAGIRDAEVLVTFIFDKFPDAPRKHGNLTPQREVRYFVNRHSLQVTRVETVP